MRKELGPWGRILEWAVGTLAPSYFASWTRSVQYPMPCAPAKMGCTAIAPKQQDQKTMD